MARVFDIRPGYVCIAINVDAMSAAERSRLGKNLDLGSGIELNQATFGENGTVRVEPVELTTLAPGIIAGHHTIVDRAAGQKTPFARFHNNDVLDALHSITGEDVPRPELPAPTTPETPTAYWKVAPGEGGSDWARCRDGGFIALGWRALGDLSTSDEADFQRRAAEGRAQHGWGAGVEQVWKFKNIQPGEGR